MKVIKIKDKYINLNHFLSYDFGKEGQIKFMGSEETLKINLMQNLSQKDIISRFDQFLLSNDSLIDFSSFLIHPDGEGLRIKEITQTILKAAMIVIEYQDGSHSLIQRKLKLGFDISYDYASLFIDQLEELGLIGSFSAGSPRLINFKNIDDFLSHLERLGIKVLDK